MMMQRLAIAAVQGTQNVHGLVRPLGCMLSAGAAEAQAAYKGLDADVDMCSPYSRREGSSSSASCSKQFPGAAAQGHFRTMMTYASSSQPTAAPALHSLCMNTLPLSASNLLPGFAASSPAVPMPTMGRGFQHMTPALMGGRRLDSEPEPFEGEVSEDEFEIGEFEDLYTDDEEIMGGVQGGAVGEDLKDVVFEEDEEMGEGEEGPSSGSKAQ